MQDRPEASEYPAFAAGYVRLVPAGDLSAILQTQRETTLDLFRRLTEEQGEYRYAEGKWMLREVLGHIADNERVWAYRALRIARGDAGVLTGYAQDRFAAQAPFRAMTLAQTIDDYAAVRQATLTLLRHLPAPVWTAQAELDEASLSVRAAGCVIAGHELHHLNVVKENYLPR